LVTVKVSASAAADPTEEKYVEVADVWPAVETDGAEPNLRVLVPTPGEASSVLEFVRRERAPHRRGRDRRTADPSDAWVSQQARQFSFALVERSRPVRFLIRYRDCNFTSDFDSNP
jgi:hypothetical protein